MFNRIFFAAKENTVQRSTDVALLSSMLLKNIKKNIEYAIGFFFGPQIMSYSRHSVKNEKNIGAFHILFFIHIFHILNHFTLFYTLL